MTIYEMLMYFFIYGFLGWCTEVAYAAVRERKFVNRGFLRGSICPIYGVGVTLVVLFLEPLQDNIFLLYISSVLLVTVLEGVTGFILDKAFQNKWWDYSKCPCNIGGYVCLLFSLAWGIACVVIVKYIHHIFADGIEYFPKVAGIMLLIILIGILLVDIYVTATNILKMNKYLSYMEDIANELNNISSVLGYDIYKGVVEVLHVGDEVKEKFDDVRIETKEKWNDATIEAKVRIMGLEKQYKMFLTKLPNVSTHLMKAFPKMDSKRHKQAISDMKKWIQKLQKHKK